MGVRHHRCRGEVWVCIVRVFVYVCQPLWRSVCMNILPV